MSQRPKHIKPNPIKPDAIKPSNGQPYRRLWGRAKGKPLSPFQNGLVETKLPACAVDILNPLAGLQGFEQISMEVGFGGAEHLLHCAQENPHIGYIGVEPFLNGIAKALAGMERGHVDNIRLHHGDVWQFLENIPDASLDHIDILYPDPWPKKRHYKRRLIQEDLIAEFHRVLKPGARLHFASDIPSYVDWALVRILRHGGFNWPVKTSTDWQTPYKNWPGTRYEAKANREGRTPHYFRFVKG